MSNDWYRRQLDVLAKALAEKPCPFTPITWVDDSKKNNGKIWSSPIVREAKKDAVPRLFSFMEIPPAPPPAAKPPPPVATAPSPGTKLFPPGTKLFFPPRSKTVPARPVFAEHTIVTNLRGAGHQVQQISPDCYRVDGKIDIWPADNKLYVLATKQNGRYSGATPEDLLRGVQQANFAGYKPAKKGL
jgi:hypothetical protein